MTTIKKYSSDELYNLFKIIHNKDIESLEKDYSELIPYKDNLFNASDIYEKYVSSGKLSYGEINWMCNFLRYISITDNKDFIVDDKVINVLGEPNHLNIDAYIFIYTCLFYPFDIYNYNSNIYISYFNRLIKMIYRSKYNKNLFSNNPRLYKLLSVIEELETTYRPCFNNNSYQFLITLILGSCYLNDNYDVLYNFLKTPNDYIDKIALKGYISYKEDYSSKWHYNWNACGKERTLQEANDIFSEDKITIR